MEIDVLKRDDSPFPASPLELQRLFPVNAHKVRDFAAWKSAFDDHLSTQTAAGMTNGRVFQSADDPNAVTILFDVADIAHAKEFVGSADLKSAMEGAGCRQCAFVPLFGGTGDLTAP